MKLNLIVIRARDLDESAEFYSALGCEFERHAHGSGPEHLACERDGIVFEIYPHQPSSPSSSGVRIGFQVNSVVEALERIRSSGRGRVVQSEKPSSWGLRAVLEDTEGHRVEIVEVGV